MKLKEKKEIKQRIAAIEEQAKEQYLRRYPGEVDKFNRPGYYYSVKQLKKQMELESLLMEK